jgi:hypothetical protein
MKLPALFLGLLLSTLAADARSGPQVTTQVRSLSSFKRLELHSPIPTEVHEGRALRVSVQIDDSLQPSLVTRVNGDTLVIDLETHGHAEISDNARVSIDMPTLSEISLEGPGGATVEGAGAHPEVDFSLRGPGGLRWSGDADLVKCRIDGPGGAVLRGNGKRIDVSVGGPGSLDASAFPISGGTFELDGPGQVKADLHGGDVSVVVNGPGSFYYTGDAHFTRQDVNGPGHIRKR